MRILKPFGDSCIVFTNVIHKGKIIFWVLLTSPLFSKRPTAWNSFLQFHIITLRMTGFYLCKILIQGDKNSMSSHQIQQICSAKRRSKRFKITHFTLSIFLNKKCFYFSLKNYLSFRIWEERIFKNLSVDPFFLFKDTHLVAKISTKPKQFAAVPA